METVYTCICGNQTWIITGTTIRCDSCSQEYTLIDYDAEMFNCRRLDLRVKPKA